MTASEYWYIRIVKLLIEKKAKLNVKNNKGFTALHYAVLENKYDTVELLIDNGCDFDAADNNGNTPLMTASRHRYIHIVKLLIENNAKVNMGTSEFWFVVNSKPEDILELIIEASNKASIATQTPVTT